MISDQVIGFIGCQRLDAIKAIPDLYGAVS
jgi:hypothetical protein